MARNSRHPRSALTGDFTTFYEAHAGRVLAYALRRAPRDVAEEVVEDVFLTAWRRTKEVPSDDPVPWLLATARNYLRNHQRSERRRTQLTVRLAADYRDADASDPALRLEQMEQAIAALEALPESLKEVVMLIAWDGLDRRAAARVLGCSVPALAVRLHRARRLLASALDPARGQSRPTNHPTTTNALKDNA